MGWRPLGGLWCFDPLLLGWLLVNNPCPFLYLIPACALYHVCLSSGPRTKLLSQKIATLPPHGPLLQPHPVTSHGMLLPRILGWPHSDLAIRVWDIDISPLSSGLLLLYFHSTEASLASVRKGGWNIFIINGYEGLKREKVKWNNWPANHILRKPIL